jgi:hypothetical protein
MEPSNIVQYVTFEEIEYVSQKFVTWLGCNYPEIFLIHQESLNDHDPVSMQLTLFHRQWGPTMKLELISGNLTQTFILIPSPPEPSMEDISSYEARILEHLPGSSASIRLARMDGDDKKALLLTRNLLREQRHHYWMQIHSGLARALNLVLHDSQPEELHRDIPARHRDMDQDERIPSQDEGMLLDMWVKGLTAKQIALRIGRTEKTILNRLTRLRKKYGEQLVPRRRVV